MGKCELKSTETESFLGKIGRRLYSDFVVNLPENFIICLLDIRRTKNVTTSY